MTSSLFKSLKVGALNVPNRIFMAPLTRCRAVAGNVPHQMSATYYAQRAAAGLIVSEATQICPEGAGYPNTPGIYSDAQESAWKEIVSAVHVAGGKIFLQLWHVGRISHPDFQPGGKPPVAPSAIKPAGMNYTPSGVKKSFVTPRALELSEMPLIVDQYRQAALRAKRAGFDGVEIHNANGYLLDQFLRDGTNQRPDIYGGSIENRARLPLEVARAVLEVWSKDEVGVRISPCGKFNDMSDSDPAKTFSYFAQKLSELKIAYLHVVERYEADQEAPLTTEFFRQFFAGVLIANGAYSKEQAEEAIDKGQADAVAFGRPFISNPDLVQRLENGVSLSPWDEGTFYLGGERGYIDYPRAI